MLVGGRLRWGSFIGTRRCSSRKRASRTRLRCGVRRVLCNCLSLAGSGIGVDRRGLRLVEFWSCAGELVTAASSMLRRLLVWSAAMRKLHRYIEPARHRAPWLERLSAPKCDVNNFARSRTRPAALLSWLPRPSRSVSMAPKSSGVGPGR